MPRIQSNVSAGLAGEKGAEQQAVGSNVAPQPNGMRINPAEQFQQADFARVVGGAKANRSQHPGAPDGGKGGEAMPGGLVLRAHADVSASGFAQKGRSAKRSAGRRSSFPSAAEND